jgi:hypothetical protein
MTISEAFALSTKMTAKGLEGLTLVESLQAPMEIAASAMATPVATIVIRRKRTLVMVARSSARHDLNPCRPDAPVGRRRAP